jgi:hypothetical protein
MTNALKGSRRRISAMFAALAIAFTITGLTVAGTASAAAPSDDVSIQAATCSSGTSSVNDGGTLIRYAWASCNDNIGGSYWRFRLVWSCTGEGWNRSSGWAPADGRQINGFCAPGKSVDLHRPETDYSGT